MDIRLYRKHRELSHNSGILRLDDKVYPTFYTHKNGVKNTTVTQFRTVTTLFPVWIWAEIIIQLFSYSGKTRDTPVNTVQVEHLKKITSHMTIKYLRSGTFSFGKEIHPLYLVRFFHGTLSGKSVPGNNHDHGTMGKQRLPEVYPYPCQWHQQGHK